MKKKKANFSSKMKGYVSSIKEVELVKRGPFAISRLDKPIDKQYLKKMMESLSDDQSYPYSLLDTSIQDKISLRYQVALEKIDPDRFYNDPMILPEEKLPEETKAVETKNMVVLDPKVARRLDELELKQVSAQYFYLGDHTVWDRNVKKHV